MCFYNDYDWTASVTETNDGPADAECRCDECGAKIAVGQWRKHVYQQEHECCQICEDNESSEYVAAGNYDDAVEAARLLDGHACNYGETCDYNRCESCDKVLRAVKAREEREGCPPNARQPALFTMWEELGEHGDAKAYAQEAVSMFPELAGNRHVVRLLASDDDND